MRTREQALVDLCFEIGIVIANNSDYFKDKTKEQVAEWIGGQLDQCGVKTIPMGMSWGVLVDYLGVN